MTMLPADLTALGDDLRPAARRAVAVHRRRRRLVRAGALAAAAVCSGAALAAVQLLGSPAPPAVQSELSELAGTSFVAQPSLQNQTARVVAVAPDATLYAVSDIRGSYCAEVVGATRGLIFGLNCTLGLAASTSDTGSAPTGFSSTTMFLETDSGVPPVVEFGRAPEGTESASARLADGTTEPVEIGLDRFYLYQPPDAHQATARRGPTTIDFRDASGKPNGSWYFQPPVVVRGEGTPLTRIVARIEVAGARLVALTPISRPADRSEGTTYVPVRTGETLEWTPPAGTQAVLVRVLGDRRRPVAETADVVAEAIWRHLLERATG